MGVINVLDISVANLIAAGEVVERPCNAIKELVENAMDAGATAVTVEIRSGGTSYMRVTDNGCGMSAEDAVVAIRRHATSKIRTASDLAAIGTLGFRGEALAAISAVCDFCMTTKRKKDEAGTVLTSHYGKDQKIESTGCPDGTTIVCERLFATTPARLKFLKTASSETSAVLQMLEKLAVSRPEISFHFIADGKTKFQTAGDNVLKNAIYSVFGNEFSSNMIAVSKKERGMQIEGYISSPQFLRGNRTLQQFYVNERSVRSKTMMAALEAAFASYIPVGKYPSCVLNITVPKNLVDVNIHPSKLEVKFSDEHAVFEAVYSAVRSTLVSDISRPTLTFSKEAMMLDAELQREYEKQPTPKQTKLDDMFRNALYKGAESEEKAPEPIKADPPVTIKSTAEMFRVSETVKGKGAMVLDDDDDISVDVPMPHANPMGGSALHSNTDMDDFAMRSRLYGSGIKEFATKDAIEALKEENGENEVLPEIVNAETDAAIEDRTAKEVPPYRIVGEVFSVYVIIETEDKMIIIDKHAAHERINFELLRANMAKATHNVQLLLAPETLDVTDAEADVAREYKAELEKVGYEFTVENRKISLLGVPGAFDIRVAKNLFMTMITESLEKGEPIARSREGIFEKALYQSSCKASIKGGIVYDNAHLRWVCDNLLRYDCIKYCPHGRPVAFELSKQELDTRFRRT